MCPIGPDPTPFWPLTPLLCAEWSHPETLWRHLLPCWPAAPCPLQRDEEKKENGLLGTVKDEANVINKERQLNCCEDWYIDAHHPM